MSNFAEDIEEAAEGEPIEATVIGNFGWSHIEDTAGDDSIVYGFGTQERTPIPADKKGVVLAWEEAKSLLDYTYDSGFGASDCHDIFAWTVSKVIAIHEYDGSTSVVSVPRHPVAVFPYNV